VFIGWPLARPTSQKEESMNITVLLADSAQAVSGKLYVLGGGWTDAPLNADGQNASARARHPRPRALGSNEPPAPLACEAARRRRPSGRAVRQPTPRDRQRLRGWSASGRVPGGRHARAASSQSRSAATAARSLHVGGLCGPRPDSTNRSRFHRPARATHATRGLTALAVDRARPPLITCPLTDPAPESKPMIDPSTTSSPFGSMANTRSFL
jgi:hypothetical protein